MTFDKQVERAKEEKLKSRIIRDVVFIVLGITFLLISILMAYNDSKKEINKSSDKKVTEINEKSAKKN